MPKGTYTDSEVMLIETLDLGTCDYGESLEIQKELFNRLIANRKNKTINSVGYLLFVEHHPVITLGKHGNKSNILFDSNRLETNGIKVYNIERGGDVTYHAPGQLVIYPVLDFGEIGLGVKQYVKILEESIIQTLKKYNLTGVRREGAPGVWLERNSHFDKICAIGLKCSRFCSMHGMALNVNTDLDGFKSINPCGFTDSGVTSIKKEIGAEADIHSVKQIFSDIFFSLIFSF